MIQIFAKICWKHQPRLKVVHKLHYAKALLIRVRLSFPKLLQTCSTCRNNTKKNVWEKSNDAYSLSIRARTDHDKPSFDLFFTTLVTSNKTFFPRANWKGIARHIDASSVVWSLIDHGKLANQIARLAAIVLKMKLPAHARVVWMRIVCAKGWGLVIFFFRNLPPFLVIFDWFVLRMCMQLSWSLSSPAGVQLLQAAWRKESSGTGIVRPQTLFGV